MARVPNVLPVTEDEVANIKYIVGLDVKRRSDEARLAAATARKEWSDDEDDAPIPSRPAAPPEPEPYVAPVGDIMMRLLVPTDKLFDGSSVLNKPSCVIALPTGDLCIADTAADRLLVVSPLDGTVRSELKGAEGGSLKQPRGLACDSTALYVSEVGGSRVRKMRLPEELRLSGAATPRGSHLGGLPLQAEKAVEGQLTFPQGLAVSHGEVFITDCEDHRVAVYDALTLTYQRGFGQYGEEEGELSFPYNCAVVGDEVVVCDVANSRLSLFHRVSGEFVRCIGGDGELLNNPRGVAVMPLQRAGPPSRGATAVPSWSGSNNTTALVVVEQKRLVVLSLAGSLLQTIDVDGAIDMWSVCLVNAAVYVTDKGASVVHVFVPPNPSTASSLANSHPGSATASPYPGRSKATYEPPSMVSPPAMRSRHPSFINADPICAASVPNLCCVTAANSSTGSAAPPGFDSPQRSSSGTPLRSASPRTPAHIDVGDADTPTSGGLSKALVEGLITGYSSPPCGNRASTSGIHGPSSPPPPARTSITSGLFRRLGSKKSLASGGEQGSEDKKAPVARV